jgi:hypothetical protein
MDGLVNVTVYYLSCAISADVPRIALLSGLYCSALALKKKCNALPDQISAFMGFNFFIAQPNQQLI